MAVPYAFNYTDGEVREKLPNSRMEKIGDAVEILLSTDAQYMLGEGTVALIDPTDEEQQ